MPLLQDNKLFGTVLRTRLLAALALVEESFPAELARILESSLFPVQRVIDALEKEGIIVTRKIGLERRVTLNPRYFAAVELRNLLLRLGEADPRLMESLAARRSRPRRRGKEL